MTAVELVLAFLARVATGITLDSWVLPPLVNTWVDRLRSARANLAHDQIGAILAVTAVILGLITRSRVSPA